MVVMVQQESNYPETMQEAEELLKHIKGVSTLPDNCSTNILETMMFGVAITKVTLPKKKG